MTRVRITKSNRKDKKLKAVFTRNGTQKTVHFGAKGYSDYTKHGDNKRKQNYLKRHKKNENWDNFYTAGSLSRHILWNKKSLDKSIKEYKKKFNLK